jgi:hypothetical protein
MSELDPCGLHEAAVVASADESEELLRLAHSPIGDECQRCTVCRAARTYIERRLAERAGRPLPANQNAEVAWRQLQAALVDLRTSLHRAP